MTGSVEFARYKTSAAAGAKLNSALAFSAKAKVGKVRTADLKELCGEGTVRAHMYVPAAVRK